MNFLKNIQYVIPAKAGTSCIMQQVAGDSRLHGNDATFSRHSCEGRNPLHTLFLLLSFLAPFVSFATTNYKYASSDVTQSSTADAALTATDAQIIGISVTGTTCSGGGCDATFEVDYLNITVNNSTAADVATAVLFYTGTSSTFNTNTPLATVTSPTGSGVYTCDRTGLTTGPYYFWLCYDLNATSSGVAQTLDAYVDANGVVIVGSTPSGGQTPTTTNPSGTRTTIGGLGNSGGGRYASATWTDFDASWINYVKFSNLNVTSGHDDVDAYTDLTANAGIVQEGVSYTMEVDIRSQSSNANCFAWIDWDNDGTFETAEQYDLGAVTSSAATLSLSIATPTTCTTDSTRMRVRIKEGSDPDATTAYGAGVKGETEDYTMFITASDAAMAYHSSKATQNNTNGVNSNTANAEVLGVQLSVTGATSPITVSEFVFNTTGTSATVTDMISGASLWSSGTSSSFAMSTQLQTTAVNPSGTFTITSTYTLGTGVNYFWLTYDVKSGATNANVIDAECTQITVSSARTPIVTAPSGTRTVNANMAYSSYNITQASSALVGQNTTKKEQLGVSVVTTGAASPVKVTRVSFLTTGCTSASTDIQNARLFYTGTSSTFSTNTPWGFMWTNPNGTFTFTLDQAENELASGTNYLWLTYDIKTAATADNVVDAILDELHVAGTSQTITTTTISGTRQIVKSWGGSSDANWGNTANWPDAAVPTSSQNITITSDRTYMPTLNVNGNCKDLTIESGATLSMSTNQLDVFGNLVNQGTVVGDATIWTFEFHADNATPATISNTGTWTNTSFNFDDGDASGKDADYLLASSATITSLNIDNLAQLDMGGYNLQVDGTVFAQTGSLDMDAGTLTITGDATPEFTNAKLTEATSTVVYDIAANADLPSNVTHDVVFYNVKIHSNSGITQTVHDFQSDGTLTLVSDAAATIRISTGETIDLNGDFVIPSGVTFDLQASSVTLAGTFSNSGTLIGSTGSAMVWDGSSSVTWAGWNDGDVELKIAGSATMTIGASITGDDMVMSSGTLLISNASTSLNFDAASTFSGGKAIISAGKLYNSVNSRGYTQTGGTVQLDGGTIQVGDAGASGTPTARWANLGGSLDINGGTLECSGHYMQSTANVGTFDMSGGVVNVATYSGATDGAAIPSFYISEGTFTMSGGTINVYDGDNIGPGDNRGWHVDPDGNTATGGTVVYTQNAANQKTYYALFGNGTTDPVLYNVEVNNSGYEIDFAYGFDVDNNFTITAGTADLASGEPGDVAGLWTNNGGSFKNNSATIVTFNGAAAQTIGGTTATTFNDVTINNTSGDVNVATACTVDGVLTLTSGDVKVPSSTTILTITDRDDATTPFGISGGSTTTHINGWVDVIRTDVDYFTIPLGNGTRYMPVQIEPDAATSVTYRVRYNASAPSTSGTCGGSGLDHVSSLEYWDVNQQTGTIDAQVRLYYDGSSAVNSEANAADLRIAHYNSGSACWENNTSGTVAVTTNSATWGTEGYVQADVTDFSPFTLSSTSTNNTLPVKLLYFTATPVSNYVDIQWATGTEENNDFFTIEKSADGLNYEKVATVNGNGTTFTANYYNIKDENPMPGTSYYRLSQTDFDGTTEEFPPVPVTFSSKKFELVGIHPNPADNTTVITFNANENDIATLKIYNSLGQQLKVEQSRTTSGLNSITLDVSEYKKGLYFIHLENTNQELIQSKLIKTDKY